MLKGYINNTINTLLSALMSFSLSYSIMKLLSFTYNPFFTLFICTIFSILFFIIFYNKDSIKASAITVSAIFVFCTVLYLAAKPFRGHINTFFLWLPDYFSGYENINKYYMFWFSLILCFIISLVVFLFTLRKFFFVIILTAGAGLFAYEYMMNLPFSDRAFYIYSLTIIIYYMKYIYFRNSHKFINEYAGPHLFSIWIVPICTIIFIISYMLPTSSKPIYWKWLDMKINNFIETHSYTSYTYFNITSAGFGQYKSKLGGYANPDKMHVLTVESPRPVYLKGGAKDNYNGLTWINTDKKSLKYNDPKSSSSMDMLELKFGMYLLTNESNYLTKYLYKDNMKITFERLKTKTLFIAPKTDSISAGKNPVYVNSDGAAFSKKKISKGFTYEIQSYNIRYSNEELQDILRRSRPGLYKETKTLPAGLSSSQMDSLIEYSDSIYAKYLQLPDNLPERVKNIALSVTAGAGNNYDMSRAIEQYLSDNMTYTYTPPEMPEEREFTDFFIFDSKQGYCTHYATAMVLMARSIGIPARYVEGYRLAEKAEGEKAFKVTNEQAHAWVEVYFEGFGWLPFEPSSIYNGEFYMNSEPIPGYDDIKPATPPQPSPSRPSASAGSNTYNNTYNRTTARRPEEQKYQNNYKPPKIENKKAQIWLKVLGYVGIILLAAFAITSLFYFNDRKVKNRMLKASMLEPHESVLYLYKYYIKLFSLLGLPLNNNETALEYCRRLDENESLFEGLSLKEVTNAFIKARYAETEPCDQDKQVLCSFYEPFMERFKAKQGKAVYFVLHYVLGIA